jgi:MYXO-CTERM domain-containing protein
VLLLVMAWSPPALSAGIVWVSAPGDYATFNSNHTPDGTSAPASNRKYGAALATLLLCRLVARRRRAPFYPIPGASLFGGSGSVLGRFNSLFGRLGNFFYDAAEINDLAALVRSRKALGSGFSQHIPVHQRTQTTCSRRSAAISVAS